MQIKEDWIVKNWAFLKARRRMELREDRFSSLFTKAEAPTTGKFYGTQDFFDTYYRQYGAYTANGNKRLALRPYIVAPMPDRRIKAIFIDPKKYLFDKDGNITGLDGCYETTFFIFMDYEEG